MSLDFNSIRGRITQRYLKTKESGVNNKYKGLPTDNSKMIAHVYHNDHKREIILEDFAKKIKETESLLEQYKKATTNEQREKILNQIIEINNLSTDHIEEIKVLLELGRYDLAFQKLNTLLLNKAEEGGASTDQIKYINNIIQESLKNLLNKKVITDKQYTALSEFFNTKTNEICANIESKQKDKTSSALLYCGYTRNAVLPPKKETVYDAAQKILNDEKELKESLQANLKELENIINDFLKKVKETNKEWSKALTDKLEKYIDETKSESLQKFAKQIITLRVAAYLNEQAGNTKLTAARKEQEIKKIIAQTTREIKTMLKKELDEVNTAKLSQPAKEKLIEEKIAAVKNKLYKENIDGFKNIWTEKVEELNKELDGILKSIEGKSMSSEKKKGLTEQIKALQGQITEMQDIINAMNITKNFDANKALEDIKTKHNALKEEINQLKTIVHKKSVNPREESIKRKLAGIVDRLSDEFKDWQTKKGEEELKEKINEIIKMVENISSIENIEALEGMLKKLGDLSLLPENIKALVEELREEVKLLKNAGALAENGSLSEETKEALLGKIKTPALVEKALALDASNLDGRFSATA